MATRSRSVIPDKVSDGGWGWVCVAACAFNQAMYRGVSMSFSILFEAMRQKYGTSATSTAWVYSISGMVTMFSASAVSPLCKKLGCRTVGMIGGVSHGFGMILTAFCTTTTQMYFTYGIFVGLANCTIVVTTPLILNQYFNKHRAKAMSLNTLGVSAGTVIFANLMGELTVKYSLTFCLIILGCITIHQVVASALFSPLRKVAYSKSADCEFQVAKTQDQSDNVIHDDKGKTETTKCESSLNVANDTKDEDLMQQEEKDNIKAETEPVIDVTSTLSNSLKNVTVINDMTDEVNVQISCNSVEHKSSKKSTEMKIKECCLFYCDIDLLKNFRFLGLFFLTLCYSTSVFMVDTTLAGWSAERGVSIRQVSWVLSVGTVVEIFARLLTGIVFDLKHIRPIRTYIYGVVTCIGTSFLFMFPFAKDITSVMFLFISFRFCTCIYFTHNTVILADVATPAKMYGGLGMVQFGRGISMLIGPLTAGVIKDVTGSFDNAFYIGGILAMISVIFYMAMLAISRRKLNRPEETQQ